MVVEPLSEDNENNSQRAQLLIENENNNDNEHNVNETPQNVSRLLGEIESAEVNTNQNNSQPSHVWGITLVMLSVCSYTCYTLIAKYLLAYRGVPYLQIVFTRSMITWLINLAWIQWYRRHGEFFNYFGERSQRKWLIIRSIGCFGANFLWIWSLLWLTPGDSDTIWQINAFWVLISAHFILGEKMDVMSWICVSVGIIGVILVAQPSFIFHTHNEYNSELEKWIGIILVLCSTFSYTVHVLIVRAKSISIHWLQFEFFTSTFATWLFIPTVAICYFFAHYLMLNDAVKAILTVYNPWIPFTDWLAVVSLGIVGCLATATLTRGTQLAQARWISIMMYSEVPLAYIGQVVFYHIYADVLTWVGAAIVLIAVLIPSVREIYMESMKPSAVSIEEENEGLRTNEGDQTTQEETHGANGESMPLLPKQQVASV